MSRLYPNYRLYKSPRCGPVQQMAKLILSRSIIGMLLTDLMIKSVLKNKLVFQFIIQHIEDLSLANTSKYYKQCEKTHVMYKTFETPS